MDCAHWTSAVDPLAAERCAGAIATLADFPVLDATVHRVVALCDDEHATTTNLLEVLDRDPTFSGNLLRFANSGTHAIRAKSVRQALMLVGRGELRQLALEAATFQFFEQARGNGGLACGDLYRHAMAVAACASVVATRVGVRDEAVRLGALAHDVGKLVLPVAFGTDACDRIAIEHPGGAERARAERERFGIDHAQAGALLCEAWRLPDEVTPAVAWHHGGPDGTAVPDRAVACVQIADGVATMAAGGQPDRALLDTALAITGLEPAVLDEVASVALTGKPTTGELARRFGERRRRRGGVDRLTQLPDGEGWRRAVEASRASGCVVLFDVDELAAINAAHGVRVGDFVLTRLASAVGPHGIAGRVGGDEIALFSELPRADAEELAAAIARQVSAGLRGIGEVTVTATVTDAAAALDDARSAA